AGGVQHEQVRQTVAGVRALSDFHDESSKVFVGTTERVGVTRVLRSNGGLASELPNGGCLSRVGGPASARIAWVEFPVVPSAVGAVVRIPERVLSSGKTIA